LEADLLLKMSVPAYRSVKFIAISSVVTEFVPVFFLILEASKTPLPLIRQLAASVLNEIASKVLPLPTVPLQVIFPYMSIYLGAPPALA
jgi:hypothetical protein